MRIAAATMLCLAGGTICFMATFQLLGPPAGRAPATIASARVMDFAVPRLAQPIPATIAPPTRAAAPTAIASQSRLPLPTFVAPNRLVASALVPTNRNVAMKDAFVPPVARRLPPREPEPVVAPQAVAEAAPPLPVRSSVKQTVQARKLAAAKKAPRPRLRTASRPFDTSGRSALGGPVPHN